MADCAAAPSFAVLPLSPAKLRCAVHRRIPLTGLLATFPAMTIAPKLAAGLTELLLVQVSVPPAAGRAGRQLHVGAVMLVGVRSAGIAMVAVSVCPFVVLLSPALVTLAVKLAAPPRPTVAGGALKATAGSEAPPLVKVTPSDAELLPALVSLAFDTLEVNAVVETPAG